MSDNKNTRKPKTPLVMAGQGRNEHDAEKAANIMSAIVIIAAVLALIYIVYRITTQGA